LQEFADSGGGFSAFRQKKILKPGVNRSQFNFKAVNPL
jgi:hypothetical protein